MNESNSVLATGTGCAVEVGLSGKRIPPIYRRAPFCDVCHFLGIAPVPEQVEENRCAYLVVTGGTYVHEREDRLENVYVIASGIAKTVYQGHNEEFIAGFFLPGEILGLDSIDGLTYHSTITALTDLLLLSIPYQVLLSYCRIYPVFDMALVRLFADRIADNTAFMEVMARARAEVKVAYFLRALALRLGTPERPLVDLDFGISRRDIANYLGIAYETLSRILQSLCEMGILEVSRSRLAITDYSALHQMCEGYVDRLNLT